MVEEKNKSRARRRFSVISRPEETESQYIYRMAMRDMVVKLNMLIGQAKANKTKDSLEYIGFLEKRIDEFCTLYSIKMSECVERIGEFPPDERGKLTDEAKRRIKETLEKYKKELNGEIKDGKEIPGTKEFIKKDFEAFKNNETEFYKGLGKLR